MKKYLAMMLSLLAFTAATAEAGTVTCAGQILQVNFHAGLGFLLQLDSMNAPVLFCDPSATWTVPGTSFTTSPEQCKAIIATFLAAKLAGRTFSVVYFDGDSTPASCSTWASWQRANIRYYNWAD